MRNFFSFSQDIKKADPPTNLVVEVRTQTNGMPMGAKFWTVFSIFDPAGNLNKGWWRLPLYECPTNLNI